MRLSRAHSPFPGSTGVAPVKIFKYSVLLLLLLVASAISQFYREVAFYEHLGRSGELPPHADTIIIPIAEYFQAMVIFTPFYFVIQLLLAGFISCKTRSVHSYIDYFVHRTSLKTRFATIVAGLLLTFLVGDSLRVLIADLIRFPTTEVIVFGLIDLLLSTAYWLLMLNLILNALFRKNIADWANFD